MEKQIVKSTPTAQQPESQQQPRVEYSTSWLAIIQKYPVGMELTPEQLEIIQRPWEDDKIQIREDGLIYVSWTEYVKRLREAKVYPVFISTPPQYIQETNEIVITTFIIVNGKIVAQGTGGAIYHPNNPRMSYSDAIEAAKSNSIMRACKDLGMGLNIWDPEFVREWKEKYAQKIRTQDPDGRIREIWVKVEKPKKQPEKQPAQDVKITPTTAREMASNMIRSHFLPYDKWLKIVKRLGEKMLNNEPLTDENVQSIIEYIKENERKRTKENLLQTAREYYEAIDPTEDPELFEDVNPPSEEMTVEDLKKYIDYIRDRMYHRWYEPLKEYIIKGE